MSPPDGTSIGAAAFAEGDWGGRADARLATDPKGNILPSVDNVTTILRHDPAWKEVIAYNEFSGLVVKRAQPPFDWGAEMGEWTDMDDARTENWFAQHYGMRRLPENALQRGVALAADANRFHDVREYLQGLKWDGIERLSQWLHLYLGVESSEYAALVGTKYLVGAVARVMRYPVKVDNVLILEGPQGAGKSTALKALFDPWFTDAAFEIGTTDGYQIIRGMWGVELAELDSFNRAESSRSKSFFSREVDRYRNPYGRKPVNVPRQCVFVGSVNHATYLKDDSGNRRYMPVRVGYIDIEELANDRDQLWAEALRAYLDDVPWWVRASETALFTEQQDQRYIGDAFEDRIREWLYEDKDALVLKQVRTADILGRALGLEMAKWTPAEQQRIGRIMARIGWPRRKAGGRDDREWVYCRPEESDAK